MNTEGRIKLIESELGLLKTDSKDYKIKKYVLLNLKEAQKEIDDIKQTFINENIAQRKMIDELKEFNEFNRMALLKVQEEYNTLKQKVRDFEKSIDDLYHQVGKVTVWNVGSDIVCDLCEELMKKKFEELKEMVKE